MSSDFSDMAAGMTSLLADELLLEVLKEMGLLIQLYEDFIVSD